MYPQNNLQAQSNLLCHTSLPIPKSVAKFVPKSLKAIDSMVFQVDDKQNQVTMETTDIAKRLEIMQRIHKSLTNGIRSARAHHPRTWLKNKALSIEATGAIFNSGQIHHHKEQSFKDELASVGFLKQSTVGTNMGQIPYTVFGIYSIVFPLRDEEGRVVNFYAIGIDNDKTDYLNTEGIYPAYPHSQTRRLYVTENIFDAATLIESKVMDNRDAVMALHDKEMLYQHRQAIESLKHLEEIILIENS